MPDRCVVSRLRSQMCGVAFEADGRAWTSIQISDRASIGSETHPADKFKVAIGSEHGRSARLWGTAISTIA